MEKSFKRMERRRLDPAIASAHRKYESQVSDMQTALKRLNKEKEQLQNSLIRAQVTISNLQVELDMLRMESVDQRLQHEREKNELQKMLIEYQSYCSHTKLVQEIKRNLHESSDLFQSILNRTVESGQTRVPSKDNTLLRKLKHPLQTSAHNSSWPDEHLDSGLSLLREDNDSSSTEFDGDDQQEALETPSQGSELSDASISELNPKTACSVAPSRRQSIQRRLSAFPSLPEDTQEVAEEDSAPVYRLVLAGDAGAGKSSFLLRLSTNEFRGDIRTTLGVDMHVKKMVIDGEETTLQIWDTAGQERFRSITRSYFRKAHGVFLLYDVTSENSFLSIKKWMDLIQESIDKPVSMCVIGNKVDLRTERPADSCVSTSSGETLATAHSALFCETSAKDGTNIAEAVLHLAREVKKTAVVRRPSETQMKVSLVEEKRSLRQCCRM